VRDSVEIGRDCDGLLLSDPEVSRRHVVLRFDGESLMVEDLGSTNGTTVNGVAVETSVPLSETDIVCLGNTELQLLRTTGRAGPPRKPMPMTGASSGPRGTTVAAGVAAGSGAVVRGKADASGARMTSIDVVADAVDEERAKVDTLAAAGGTITIVFSDIESSTEMAMSLGDTKWFDVLGEHNEIIRRNLERYDGTEVKSQGDGFMLTFPGARIANLADGGQILASSITKEITSSRGDLEFGEARDVALKGIDGTYQVYEVVWAEPDDGAASPSDS
jgi:class 3 adenylate cyclase